MVNSSHHLLGEGFPLPERALEHIRETRRLLLDISLKNPHAQLRESNLALTKKAVAHSSTDDILLIHAVHYVEDLDRVLNTLANRLRDWYSLPHPEFVASVEDNRAFVEKILSAEPLPQETFGSELSDTHFSSLRLRAHHLHALYKERDSVLGYIEETMSSFCPNILAVAGGFLSAKLLSHAGSLRRFAIFPSSTIQLFGAEKALFRHLKTGSRPPKYGVLLSHGLVQQAQKNRQGRAARILADKLSLAARIDFFKGEFQGNDLLADAKKKIEGAR